MRIMPGFQNIRIGGNDSQFHDAIENMIKQIAATSIGNQLLVAINDNKNGNLTWIGLTNAGNITQVVNNDMSQLDRPFVLLRGLVRQLNQDSKNAVLRKQVSDEIATALRRAETRGRSKRTLAQRLSVTPGEALGTTDHHNVKMVDDAKKAPHAPTTPVASVLDELCNPNGKWYVESLIEGSGHYTFGDLLARVLHRDLSSGPGQTTKIMFNPAVDESCVGDGKMAKRPPVIGLYHELVHAYRNVRGRRLFDDFMSCSLPDDELMTTGLEPYTYVRFTENKFRGAVGEAHRPGYR